MPLKINLETMSFKELIDLAIRARLNEGAALRAMAKLGPDGRKALADLMREAIDKADPSLGVKGINIRGSLVNLAKKWRNRDHQAALAFWELAAAGIRERYEAIAAFQAGVTDRIAIGATAGDLGLFQIKVVSLALGNDWPGVLKALEGHARHGAYKDPNGRFVVQAGEDAVVAVDGNQGCLILQGRPPIPLPQEATHLFTW
jgi:hypothetical protein